MQMDLDPLVTAKNVYKQIMENERVRVLEVIFEPGDVAKMHHHPDHVVYAVTAGRLSLTSEGKTDEIELKQGQVLFLNVQNHEAKNTGTTTVDLIVVELKK